MWILFKLVVALIGFLIRFARLNFESSDGRVEGTDYYLHTNKAKDGTILNSKAGIPFSFPALFSFHFEDSQDGFWKKLGLSHEFQTGDQEFDRKIYITSDNSGLHEMLQGSEKVRSAVMAILDIQAGPSTTGRRLRFDGSKLWLETQGAFSDTVDIVRGLIVTKTTLLSAKDTILSPWRDRFFLKALLIESTLWSFGAYAFSAFIDTAFHSEDHHLRFARLALFSAISATVLILVALMAIVALLRGSSRAHRIIVESKVVLGVALPMAAFSLFSDINQELDPGPSVTERLEVRKIETRSHRRRRGGTYYTYHVYLAPTPGTNSPAVEGGRWIEITHSTYQAGLNKREAFLEVSPGRLGVPWIKNLSFE